MYIYHKQKFCFFHQWKCGGTSVYRLLREKIGHPDLHLGNDGLVPSNLKIDKLDGKVLSVHSPLKLFIEIMIKQGLDVNSYSIYTNVRHPFPRAVSGWAWSKEKGHTKLPFHAWFKKVLPKYRWQSEYIRVDGKLPSNLKVFVLENDIENFWAPVFLQHFGIEEQLPKLNESIHQSWDKVLSSNEQKVIIEKETWLLSKYYGEGK